MTDQPNKPFPRKGAKPGDPEPGVAKPGETKPGVAKPAETKPAETKPSQTGPGETKPVDSKPAPADPTEAVGSATPKPAGASTASPRATTGETVVLPENALDAPATPPASPSTVEASGAADRLGPAPASASSEAKARLGADDRTTRPDPAVKSATPAEPVRQTAASSPAAAEKSGLGVGSLAAVVLLGLAAGFGGAALYEQLVPSSEATRLADLERRIAAPPPQIAALEQRMDQRIARVEQASQEVRGVADKALAQAGQAAKEAAAPSADPAAVEALGRRVGALEALPQRIDGLASAQEGRGQAIAALETKLGALAKTVADSPDAAAVRAVIRLTLADRVQGALRAGRPYAEALASLSRLGADGARIAALEPFAKGGAPGGAALARDFRAAVAKAGAAQPQASAGNGQRGEGDWKDRLFGLADKIVTVTPVAPAPARPDGAARLETALERGAFTEALQAFDALPETARQAAEGVGAALRRRVAAEEAAAALAGDAVAAVETAMR